MERIARVNDAYSNIMASVDDIYGAVKKMEGSYNNVWKRANRLLRECEKHQLDKTAVGGPLEGSHLQSPGPDALGLGSSDSHDLRSIIAAQVLSDRWRDSCSMRGAVPACDLSRRLMPSLDVHVVITGERA